MQEHLDRDTDDRGTSLSELREMVRQFVAERNWEKFHSPKNLSMALTIEAGELMEHFQWLTIEESRELAQDPERRAAAGEELADILCYALAIANEMNLDVAGIMRSKMRKNIAKYPAEQFYGVYEKPATAPEQS